MEVVSALIGVARLCSRITRAAELVPLLCYEVVSTLTVKS